MRMPLAMQRKTETMAPTPMTRASLHGRTRCWPHPRLWRQARPQRRRRLRRRRGDKAWSESRLWRPHVQGVAAPRCRSCCAPRCEIISAMASTGSWRYIIAS